ncbi:Plasmid replication region DNA-binding N-term [Yersinia pseudotuberculosis]|uniref:DNA-binding protein n=1 Tax=Yersinia pseudotuberculosis TaxID=633 RepID=UPI0005E570FD|nr:DNA-binding protein [Yersinia pseudotuberculosis]BCU90669.1 KfrAs [Yersinia pseudotuberculosis]CNK26368.1 Plasmid replication region DNA-binding N-term [Yersinia pseudotuberculosis]
MKIKPEIRDKILSAANSLQAEGVETPTNEQVREYLGGGSLSHISPVMREWRDSKKSEVAAALEIPADLKKVIETSLGQVWTSASKLASTTIDNIRKEADSAIETATAERDEALSEIIRLEGTIAELKKALEKKNQCIIDIEKEQESKTNKIMHLSTENASLIARIEEKNEQIHDLKDEIKSYRSDYQKLQDQLVEIANKPSN